MECFDGPDHVIIAIHPVQMKNVYIPTIGRNDQPRLNYRWKTLRKDPLSGFRFRMISLLAGIFLLLGLDAGAQNKTIPAGSYLINMGVTPQTKNNALRPYGMIYDLSKNYGVAVNWYINPSKGKDGIDLTHNGTDYKSGVFIILQQYRTPAVNARITYWNGEGVSGNTTVSSFDLPLSDIISLNVAPKWTLDKQNGLIATDFFINAAIPASAYGGADPANWKLPGELNCCDDLFVMPHADPIWSTHSNLLDWNLDCKGGIWAGCHAVSALENMVNPSNRDMQTNFLTVKDPDWKGTSGNYTLSNALILWGDHDDGSTPYSYRLHTDPVAQFIGTLDAATQNGSERIFIPRQGIVADPTTYNANAVSRWNPGAKVIVYDPTQVDVTDPDLVTFKNVASVLIYGYGFDNPDRGLICYEASHDIAKASAPANVAAQRAFFNWGFLASQGGKAPIVDLSAIPLTFNSGQPSNISISISEGTPPFNIAWSSSCGGSFSPNNGDYPSTTFTAPVVNASTPCNITVMVSDLCGRQTNGTQFASIEPCMLTFTNSVTNVACNGESNGQIDMAISGSPGPFTWNWARVSPAGSGSGSGTTISGLSAGTYNVTVTDGEECTGTFSQLITQPPVLTATPAVTSYLCFGETGAINLTVTGGTSPYSYNWSGPNGFSASTKDITGLLAGTYNVTVTDGNSCTATATAAVTGPAAAVSVALDSKQDVSCNGDTDGALNITASGGTPGYTYLWSDGSTSEDRSGLAPGSYTVTVTDANSCTGTLTATILEPAPLVLSVIKTDPTCPPGADPPSLGGNGEIDLTVAGGTAPYTYDWNDLTPPPAEPQDRTGLTEGTYSVTVTDDNGCTASVSVTLTAQNPLPSPPAGINY